MISISEMASKHGIIFCEALPAIHAFSGCGFTALFLRKGKLKPLKQMEGTNENNYLELFSTLGKIKHVTEKQISDTERFVCALYGMSSLSCVNEGRFQLFLKSFAPKDDSYPLKKVKGTDPSSFPSCGPVIKQTIACLSYVTYIWKHAHEKHKNEDFNPEWMEIK